MFQGGRRNLSEVVDMFQGGRRNLSDMVDMFCLKRGNMVTWTSCISWVSRGN